MVKGLDVFRDHFADHQDNYVLIGGELLHNLELIHELGDQH